MHDVLSQSKNRGSSSAGRLFKLESRLNPIRRFRNPFMFVDKRFHCHQFRRIGLATSPVHYRSGHFRFHGNQGTEAWNSRWSVSCAGWRQRSFQPVY